MTITEYVLAKYNALRLVDGGKTTVADAARSLGLSYRQTFRLWQKYRTACGSLQDFAVASRPARISWNAKVSETVQAIIESKKAHPHRSCGHIADEISEAVEPVSVSTVRRVLANADLLSEGERMTHVYTRFEATAFGERLQMDTTSGSWLWGYRLIYLIAVIDDYSRMLVAWKWVDSDSAWNNMCVLRMAMEKYGLPKTLYTDNASMFKTIRHNKSVYQTHKQEGYETEIQRAMRELGVVAFSHKPYEPQSKGKVERFFRFVQERFVREHTATDLEELNLQFAKWAKWYNAKHVNRTTGCKPKDRTTPSAFGPVPEKRRLDSAFCVKDTRKVDKCNEFSYEGRKCVIDKKKGCYASMTVDLEVTPEQMRVYYRGTLVETF